MAALQADMQVGRKKRSWVCASENNTTTRNGSHRFSGRVLPRAQEAQQQHHNELLTVKQRWEARVNKLTEVCWPVDVQRVEHLERVSELCWRGRVREHREQMSKRRDRAVKVG